MKIIIVLFAVTALAAFSYSEIGWPELTEGERDPRVTASEAAAQDGLHPIVEDKKEELKDKAAERDIDIVITEGYRSIEEQQALFERGRSADGDIVTNAAGGESYHNYGLAVDFALRSPEGSVVWDIESDFNGSGQADWLEVVDIAKDLGFEWGGDWDHFKDYPHLQMSFGLSIQELKEAAGVQ